MPPEYMSCLGALALAVSLGGGGGGVGLGTTRGAFGTTLSLGLGEGNGGGALGDVTPSLPPLGVSASKSTCVSGNPEPL